MKVTGIVVLDDLPQGLRERVGLARRRRMLGTCLRQAAQVAVVGGFAPTELPRWAVHDTQAKGDALPLSVRVPRDSDMERSIRGLCRQYRIRASKALVALAVMGWLQSVEPRNSQSIQLS